MRDLLCVRSGTSSIYNPVPSNDDQMSERALKHTLSSIRTIAKSQCGKLLTIDDWTAVGSVSAFRMAECSGLKEAGE